MAFSNGFQGDVTSLGHILQTLEAKVVAIPGLTCSEGLSVSSKGETAYYFTRGSSNVGTGTLGAKLTYVSTGVSRVDIPMTSAITINDVIPAANFEVIGSADVVADRVIMNAIDAANKYNEKFLDAVSESTGTITGTAALTKATVYGAIVDAVKEFKVKNKAKGLKPKSIIVGPTVASLLLQSPEFIRSTELGDKVVSEAFLGRIAGLAVVESQDLDETTAKIDFIVMHPEGFGAPLNVNTFMIGDGLGAGYPGGKILAGEMGYGLKISDNDLILIRKHA